MKKLSGTDISEDGEEIHQLLYVKFVPFVASLVLIRAHQSIAPSEMGKRILSHSCCHFYRDAESDIFQYCNPIFVYHYTCTD